VSYPQGGGESPLAPMRQANPLSPERVRTWEFSRTPLGRRGYNEDEVRLFLARAAEELAAGDAEKAALRAEVRRLRNYYRDHNIDVDTPRPEVAESGPSIAAINLMSQAQQAADAQVAQAEEYCRRLVAQAREHYEDVLREAAEQASQAAEAASAAYEAAADSEGGEGGGFEREALERRIAWLRTFAEVTQVQLRSVLEALTREVDKLGDLPTAPAPPAAPTPSTEETPAIPGRR
jgi:DivIVA domain-containing protein